MEGEDFIFEEILSRLSVKSLFRFKLVCKNWNKFLTYNRAFPMHHSKKAPNATTFFCLNSEIIFSQIFICNPITNNTVCAPSPTKGCAIGLACDPRNPTFGFTLVSPSISRVVIISGIKVEWLKFRVYSSKTGEWKVSEYDLSLVLPDNRFMLETFPAVHVGKKLYWSLIEHIMWFDIEKDVASLIRLPNHYTFVDHERKGSGADIGECDGELSYSGMTLQGNIEIWLLEDNDEDFKWVKKHIVWLQRIIEENWDSMLKMICHDLNIKEQENASKDLAHRNLVKPLPYSGGEEVWFSMRNLNWVIKSKAKKGRSSPKLVLVSTSIKDEDLHIVSTVASTPSSLHLQLQIVSTVVSKELNQSIDRILTHFLLRYVESNVFTCFFGSNTTFEVVLFVKSDARKKEFDDINAEMLKLKIDLNPTTIYGQASNDVEVEDVDDEGDEVESLVAPWHGPWHEQGRALAGSLGTSEADSLGTSKVAPWHEQGRTLAGSLGTSEADSLGTSEVAPWHKQGRTLAGSLGTSEAGSLGTSKAAPWHEQGRTLAGSLGTSKVAPWHGQGMPWQGLTKLDLVVNQVKGRHGQGSKEDLRACLGQACQGKAHGRTEPRLAPRVPRRAARHHESDPVPRARHFEHVPINQEVKTVMEPGGSKGRKQLVAPWHGPWHEQGRALAGSLGTSEADSLGTSKVAPWHEQGRTLAGSLGTSEADSLGTSKVAPWHEQGRTLAGSLGTSEAGSLGTSKATPWHEQGRTLAGSLGTSKVAPWYGQGMPWQGLTKSKYAWSHFVMFPIGAEETA
ncbi:hypothetical protein Scep_018970 [Stephania cephalantha]|uniref:F-box domain-containing protein n=1 Tax=Stephania cephalantha TaxID=152367 RepID=A0AAP0IAY1_9MAGN